MIVSQEEAQEKEKKDSIENCVGGREGFAIGEIGVVGRKWLMNRSV